MFLCSTFGFDLGLKAAEFLAIAERAGAELSIEKMWGVEVEPVLDRNGDDELPHP